MPSYDMDAHADVYIVSRAGRMGYPTVLWRMTVADAQRVCSHPSTRGTNWMLCWTTHDLIETKWFAKDDGRFAALFEELGVTVLASRARMLSGEAAISATPVPPRLASSPATHTQLDMFGDAA